jgi:translation initiation factor 3 subunit H
VEVPVKIKNSSLADAFLLSSAQSPIPPLPNEKSEVSSSINYLEKNLETLIDSLDELIAEQNKFQFYQRNVQKQQSQLSNWLQKRVNLQILF